MPNTTSPANKVKQLSVGSCKLLSLREITDERGSLAIVEGSKDIPFEVRRVYYLYGARENTVRGGHAHKELQQLFVAIRGSFDVVLDDGHRKMNIRLESPSQGLYICPMIWRELANFRPGSICLVLASTLYDEGDYFRSYEDFLASVRKGGASPNIEWPKHE